MRIVRRNNPWFSYTMTALLAAIAGMILMYWLVDWGTHGYSCQTTVTQSVCSKELQWPPRNP